MSQFSNDSMDYVQFTNQLLALVQSQLTPEETFTLESVPKNNGVSIDAFCFQNTAYNPSPLIHVDDWYQHYQNGQALDSIAKDILDFARNLPSFPSDIVEQLMRFSEIRTHLVFKLIHYEKNKEMLRSIPHQRFLDLAVVCCILLPTLTDTFASIIVSDYHLRYWNLSQEELFSHVRSNVNELYPPVVCTIDETLGTSAPDDFDGDKLSLSQTMYVFTNPLSHFGASAVFYGGDALDRLANQLDHNLFLLPSSIHEFIIVPATEENDWFSLTELVQQVNALDLDPAEWLSDHAYYYSREHQAIFAQMPLDSDEA